MAKHTLMDSAADAIFDANMPLQEPIKPTVNPPTVEKHTDSKRHVPQVYDSQKIDSRTLQIMFQNRERRSKKSGFLLRPSLYERIRMFSFEHNVSMNDIVDEALEDFCSKYNIQ